MRRAVIKGMVVANATCAVLIDESTSLARASCLVVYLRATFDERIGPVTFFLDIIDYCCRAQQLKALRQHC